MGRTSLAYLIATSLVPPVAAFAQKSTIRYELITAGIETAVGVPGHPDLDRPLTSSGFAATDRAFAGTFYYADEPQSQDGLPLHVALFERRTRRWLYATLDDQLRERKLMTGFSVMSVQLSDRYLLLETHATPSASFTIVLDFNLKLVTVIDGFEAAVLRDGSIAFIGNMVHFAPTHQASLWVWDPASKREVEAFGGDSVSPLGEHYRKLIRDAYARLPERDRKGYEASNYGPVDDFDRDLSQRIHSADGNRVAMTARYSCDRLYWGRGNDLLTLVTCDRRGRAWSCHELDLETAVRALAVRLQRDGNGYIDPASLDSLVHAAVRRR